VKGPLFYAKVLLFGEYGIIKDAKGLSIPYNFYKGALKISDTKNDQAQISNQKLTEFVDYLEKINRTLVTFNIKQLREDLSRGLYFDSSIPQGYGIGSSGALVAAVYDRYAHNKITILENLTRVKLLKLKQIFGQMESFFHGKSSGLDPLNSFLSLPILIHSKDILEPTGIPSQPKAGKGAVFLLDSGSMGETAPMVNIFMQNMESPTFRKMIKEQFISYSDRCVEHFLSGDIISLFGDLKRLSKTVLTHFKPMIPEQFHALWKTGIDTNAYYLKLCGSGGGGYILGFTEDITKAQSVLKDHRLEVIYTF
jgi:mevalonate kinase